MSEILYSASIGFSSYRDEMTRDTRAMEDILKSEGIPFVPFDADMREEDYFERTGETDFFDVWEAFQMYHEELIGILGDNGISAYADGYAGMFYIERDDEETN